MEVNTRSGEQNLTTENVLVFPQGLPGFEEHTHFRLYQEEEGSTLFTLESQEDPETQFTVVDPEVLKVHYQIALNDDECASLRLEAPESIVVLVMLYRDQAGMAGNAAPGPIQANFLGPLVINADTRIGIQKVLNQVEGYVTIQAD